jgi:hypothetical protein
MSVDPTGTWDLFGTRWSRQNICTVSFEMPKNTKSVSNILDTRSTNSLSHTKASRYDVTHIFCTTICYLTEYFLVVVVVVYLNIESGSGIDLHKTGKDRQRFVW